MMRTRITRDTCSPPYVVRWAEPCREGCWLGSSRDRAAAMAARWGYEVVA
jgi:hypothetical protein